MFCIKCGLQLADEVVFCSKLGAKSDVGDIKLDNVEEL